MGIHRCVALTIETKKHQTPKSGFGSKSGDSHVREQVMQENRRKSRSETRHKLGKLVRGFWIEVE